MPNHRLGEGGGCRFLNDASTACGADRREGSSYCAEHHARCYLSPTEAEEKKREYAALAKVVSAGTWAAPTYWKYYGPSRDDLREYERRRR